MGQARRGRDAEGGELPREEAGKTRLARFKRAGRASVTPRSSVSASVREVTSGAKAGARAGIAPQSPCARVERVSSSTGMRREEATTGAMKSSHLGLSRARCPASVSDAPTGWCTVTRSSSRPRRYSEKCLKPFGVPGEGGVGRQCEARRGRREEAPRARRRARFVGDARAGRCGSARSARDERLRTYPQTPEAERLRVELVHLAPDAS